MNLSLYDSTNKDNQPRESEGDHNYDTQLQSAYVSKNNEFFSPEAQISALNAIHSTSLKKPRGKTMMVKQAQKDPDSLIRMREKAWSASVSDSHASSSSHQLALSHSEERIKNTNLLQRVLVTSSSPK